MKPTGRGLFYINDMMGRS